MRRLAKGAIAGGACTALGVALSSAPMLASAACDGHECDPSVADWGCASADVSPDDPCCSQGDILDDGTGNTWESSPQSGDWLDYAASRTWRLHTAGWMGDRVPVNEEIWVAFAPSDGTSNPFPANDPATDPVSAAASAPGNLGEVTYASAGLVEVENATCSPYLARVLVTFAAPADGGLTPKMTGGCQKKHALNKDASTPDGG